MTKQVNEKRKRRRQWLLAAVLLLLACINGAGLYIGNVIYKETSVLNTHLHAQNTARLRQRLETGNIRTKWEDVSVESHFGYSLHGTYIPNPRETDKTLIFLHGFSESRAAGLSYISMYINSGFNLLLVDSRAHGESGGTSVTWGNYEKHDLDQWVTWARQRFPEGMIGVHGISMGAATALMHAELNETDKRVSFYVADSAYSDFETLLALQLAQRAPLPALLPPELLLPYANIVSYLQSRFTFHQASPLRSVRKITTPVLYLHGEADTLVPVSMSLELYNATKGPRQIYIFPKAEHVSAIFKDWYRYGRVVQGFVQSIDRHS